MSEPAVKSVEDDNKKSHRKPRAGRKAEKKKSKNKPDEVLTAKQRNPKAFAINSAIRAERQFRRHQDLTTKKQHIPLVDRSPVEPPPIVVAVVGPSKVGKTTLIRSLIKNFTRQPLTTITGPVTVVSGKRRRITIIECNNDVSSMIDVAKVVDLVFLMIDGSFGFEMEIFEFLNICQVHGMPKIMGILTHLDMLKNNKLLKQTKKALKHRFWTEVYPGAKLFYLSKIVHGEYLRSEIERLGRFIAVMKFRPLSWQTSHPYILADRMEDITSPALIEQNPKCDRTVCLYGFIRGIPLHKDSSIHISGYGDTRIADISFLPDPCPLPDRLKKRSLVEKEKLIYAPFSGVGGIVYDKDAVYIELGGSHSHKKADKEDRPEQELFTSLVSTKETLDSKLENCELQLFSGAEPITGSQFVDESINQKAFETVIDQKDGRSRRKVNFPAEKDSSYEENVGEEDSDDSDDSEDEDIYNADSDSDEENTENTEFQWKENIVQKAADAFVARQNTSANLYRLVYETNLSKTASDDEDEDAEVEVGGIFKVITEKKKRAQIEKDTLNAEDSSKFVVSHMRDWSSEEVRDTIRDYFLIGENTKREVEELLEMDCMDDDDEMMLGDFEDLETGVCFKGEETTEEKPKREMTKAELLQKKQKLKEKFNAEYDEKDGDGGTYYDDLKQEMTKQAELNKTQFEGLDDAIRVQLEGYRPGMYVRIEVAQAPSTLVTNFDPSYPLLIGGLQPGEENIGFVHGRIKKHRWYNKILKTKDPIIISLGWRKFQTLPVYYKLEDNFRQRMLKYTPEHVTCMSCFWGPLTKPGTGFLAVQDLSSRQEGFRIIATGTILEANQSSQITKKLKLIGEPLKVFKKSAFIKNMFTSSLEVAKFEGARIKTVSGIRGQIKRACSKPEGAFRATFEDCIKLSDIVFCRTWVKVDVPQFYNLVTTLLLPPLEKSVWRGMKTTGELKREQGIRNEPQADSLYRPVIRKKRPVKPIKIPRRLQSQLPYKDKPKTMKIGPSGSLKKQKVAVIRDPHEYKVASLMRMLRTNYLERQGKQRREMKDRVIQRRKEMKTIERVRNQKEKERRKRIFIKKTKAEARENKAK